MLDMLDEEQVKQLAERNADQQQHIHLNQCISNSAYKTTNLYVGSMSNLNHSNVRVSEW
jgi:hypothetical protein